MVRTEKPSQVTPAVKREFEHSNFFVLRTPLLPIDELTAWSEGLTAAQAGEAGDNADALQRAWNQDVQTLRERLGKVVARPQILHALYVASPSLQSGIEHWKRDPDSKKGIQAERALVRYFTRMAARSTPFGLFSGCSSGRMDDGADATSLVLKPREQYRLCSRLDFDYLFALTAALRQDPALEMELQYWPNSSLHKIADAWFYTESRLAETKRTHHLVRIESDAYLEAVLERSQNGAGVAELVDAVLRAPGDADPSGEEAKEYVLGLIRDNEILVPSLSPLLTGKPPLDEVIDQLESVPAGAGTAAALRKVRNGMIALERGGLNGTPADYEAITSELEKLPAKIDRARLYQVDMIKPVDEAVLGKAVITELVKAVEILSHLGQGGEPEELESFRAAFSARYELAMVPLMDALDEEIGIGFGSATGRTDASPLLRGLRLKGGEEGRNGRPLGVHPSFFRQVIECIRSGNTELELDLSDWKTNEAKPPKLANAFSVMGTLVASSSDALRQGDFEFLLHGSYGPSGARLLGRFCHEDPQIEAAVRHHLSLEEAHEPQAVFAEVVYLPEGRIGNVLCRPVLREYEITYLGRSGAPAERQLPVSDLLVGVRGGSIVLYSRRLERRVIPRLTNAHGFMNPQLSSVYRFLCYLQHQHGESVPNFSWGALDTMDFLPRVRIGRLILSAAHWRLSEKEVEVLGKREGSERFADVQRLRRRRGLPRWVVLQEADNSLPVDLDNALSVDAFVHVLKRGAQASLTEMYPPADRACVSGPEGSFYHELNVPFVRKLETPASKEPDQASDQKPRFDEVRASRDVRICPPGSDWLYVKLYGGAGSLDDILTTAALRLVRNVTASGCVSRWFFIRFGDPHDHLRIRFNGTPSRLRQELLPAVYEAFNPLLASGKIWKIEMDTYQREIERYGGIEGMDAAEDVFHGDSEAVLDVLKELEGDEGLDIRWRVGLMGIDRLLTDYGFDEEAKRAAVAQRRDAFQAEFKTSIEGKRQLGDKFRKERRKLDALLDYSSEGNEWRFAKLAFERRSEANMEACKKLRSLAAGGKLTVGIPELVASYSHMHINRLIRASQVPHEFVLYDFLYQLYDGRLARQASAKTLTLADEVGSRGGAGGSK